MTALNFTKVGDDYVSSVIDTAGETAIEVKCNDGEVFRAEIEISVSGNDWLTFAPYNYDTYMYLNVLVNEGNKLRVRLNKQPIYSNYV